MPAKTNVFAIVALALTATGVPAPARAGGGPENVFLLVNANSDSSTTIANHFIALRHIPPTNVVYLDWKRGVERTGVETFREEILRPALATIARRGLNRQIDYLVYSSDFPWSVDLKADVGEVKPADHLNTTGSLTGVTYLSRFVLAESPKILSLANNFYADSPSGSTLSPGPRSAPSESRALRSSYGWLPWRKPTGEGGQHYLLSTMLGVTSGRGNTVDEVIGYLKKSATADGTRPAGTIYFVQNNTPRSRPRHDLFPAAVEQLQELGIRAEILQGQVPRDKRDVQGAMLGTAKVDWQATGSTILPGAICEHFTSYGGRLSTRASQTPLSEFLRFGAAGSSGTVVEPYAIGAKFPTAMMHVHYARGCSLAESFYQSVTGPYQLLVVGDPLCRPWAMIPKVTLADLRAGETLRGTVTLQPQATIDDGRGVGRFELFIDGRRVAKCAANESFELDTTKLPDGHHVLRVVAVAEGPIETQGRLIVPVLVNNKGMQVELTGPAERHVRVGESVRLTAQATGAKHIAIYQNMRTVGTIAGESGTLELDVAELGRGPVSLRAVALVPRPIASPPLHLHIED